MNAVLTPQGLGLAAPFRPPRREQTRIELSVEGEIPPWLRGDLLRTCPAVFERGPWRATHLFDGLGMLFGFAIDAGRVHYRNRLLQGEQRARIEAGQGWHAAWAHGPQRSTLGRVLEPVPRSTDNANVNLCRVGEDFVAMTETPHQLRFDPETLETLGTKRYDDDLGDTVSMIAHPHYDARTQSVVSVGYSLGRKSELFVYTVGPDGRHREIVAKKAFRRVPYVHDFSLTENYALLVLHPYEVDPMRMLWTKRGMADHFVWDGSRPARVAVIDRRDGTWTEVDVEGAPFFVFHPANAFETPDGELVMDVLAYPDASIIDALRIEALQRDATELHANFVRLRIDRDRRSARREALSDAPFEFPIVDYRRRSGRNYRFCWGADNVGREREDWRGQILKVDTHHGDVQNFTREGWNLGEPIFVPRHASDFSPEAEDDGLLLVVASDLWADAAELLVLDARSLDLLARAEVGDGIPIGFHGKFFSRR